jgi:[acyl-carrier-protein] S-malonyltransferase
MGKSLYEAYPVARQIFEQADTALGFSLSDLCFQGPEDQLRLTENTQPALLTVSIAAFLQKKASPRASSPATAWENILRWLPLAH